MEEEKLIDRLARLETKVDFLVDNIKNLPCAEHTKKIWTTIGITSGVSAVIGYFMK